jgi:hypothetical protein
MSRKRKKYKSIGNYFFKSFVVAWSFGLILFFINPNKGQYYIHVLYNWFAGKNVTTATPQPKNECDEEVTHAWQMNDDVGAYWKHSHEHGLEKRLNYYRQIAPLVEKGMLVEIVPTENYLLDTMYYSFPFVLPHVKTFLDTLSARFEHHLRNTDLVETKLLLTSLLRTTSSVNRLQKRNKNAIKNSSHLHGTTFDISYATFFNENDQQLSEEKAHFLKEILAKTLFDLRAENKCWVKYELFQTCFHVVVRKPEQSL